MNFFHRRSILKQANFLDLTPLRIVAEEITAENLVIILMPKFTSKFAQKYIVPRLKTKYFRIKLDAFASATWLLIDGNRNIEKIATELTQQFGDKIQPVAERLSQFFSMLYQQQLITFRELV